MIDDITVSTVILESQKQFGLTSRFDVLIKLSPALREFVSMDLPLNDMPLYIEDLNPLIRVYAMKRLELGE